MQAIGQLDDHDADILRHGDEHLAQAFGFLFVAQILAPLAEPVNLVLLDLLQLGHAIHQGCDIRAEFLPQPFQVNVGVLDHVVQQASGDGIRVHADVGQEEGHGQGVLNVRLARLACLAAMGLFSDGICAFDECPGVASPFAWGDVVQYV